MFLKAMFLEMSLQNSPLVCIDTTESGAVRSLSLLRKLLLSFVAPQEAFWSTPLVDDTPWASRLLLGMRLMSWAR